MLIPKSGSLIASLANWSFVTTLKWHISDNCVNTSWTETCSLILRLKTLFSQPLPYADVNDIVAMIDILKKLFNFNNDIFICPFC